MGQCPLGELEHASGTLLGVMVGRDLHKALAVVLHEASCGDVAVTHCLHLFRGRYAEIYILFYATQVECGASMCSGEHRTLRETCAHTEVLFTL